MIKHYIFRFYENFNLDSFDNKLSRIYKECELTGTRIKVTFDLSNMGIRSIGKIISIKPILDAYRAQAKDYLIESNILVPNETTRFLVSNAMLFLKPVSKVNFSVN
jgi:hypothetical protein